MIFEFLRVIYTASWSLVSICGVACAFCLLVGDISFCEIDERKYFSLSKLFMTITIICAIVGTMILLYTAEKEMAVANIVTYENVEAVKGEATELIDYIIDSVDKLNANKE